MLLKQSLTLIPSSTTCGMKESLFEQPTEHGVLSRIQFETSENIRAFVNNSCVHLEVLGVSDTYQERFGVYQRLRTSET